MVRRYDATRPVPADVTERIVRNGLRAPSAGFSQGWGFLVSILLATWRGSATLSGPSRILTAGSRPAWTRRC
jgi:hypothetical protein